ncbi:MAG: restriction endonuclease subunit S [Flavobacteriales bacterium]|nr:restriction endonuclease subunit S [Flavobacteriales bacterium]
MMSSHSPTTYTAYKPTGIPWLPQAPEHWEVQSLGSLTTAVTGRNRTDLPLLSVVREKGVILRSSMSDDENHNRIPDDLRNYKYVRKGNLVINKMKAWQGSLGIAPVDGIVSPAYYVFALHVAEPMYGHALLRSKPYVGAFARYSDGVRIGQWDLSIHGMRRIPVVLPPKDEQHLIVRYLRALDAKVKRYIRTKRKLIAALQEQKQAIIQRAVTRGLDPNVKLKPSGVEWLGEVPEHWEVRRSKTLFRERKELARPSDVQLSATQAYGVIPQDEFEARVGRRVVKISMHLEKRKHVELDDFVISMRSFQGGLERAWAAGAIRSSYVILKPLAEVDVDFFTYVLKAPGYIKALQSTADFIRDGQDLNFADFSKVPLPLPPHDEQRGIALHIREAIISTEEAMTRVAREIDVIQEYHTRLIADVVTGAVDVREAAVMLPDEDQMIGRSEDQMMEEEPLSMAAEGEAEYGEEGQ